MYQTRLLALLPRSEAFLSSLHANTTTTLGLPSYPNPQPHPPLPRDGAATDLLLPHERHHSAILRRGYDAMTPVRRQVIESLESHAVDAVRPLKRGVLTLG